MTYVGIDLGTTYSAVSILNGDGEPTTLTNAEGDRTTPSALLFDSDVDVIVGRDAKAAAAIEPERVAICPKRFMGRDLYPGKINGKDISPVVLSSLILTKLKDDAEVHIGPIQGAVITVPAYFDDLRRRATEAAAELSGLDLLGIINEPTAAALAYAYSQIKSVSSSTDDAIQSINKMPERIALVYDLGGGTFDVTIIRMKGLDIEVLGTDGDVQLGGRDWDLKLVDEFGKQFHAQYNTDPREDPESLQLLYQTAEEVKKTLSSRPRARFMVNHGGYRLSGQIDREQFEELTSSLLFRTENRVNLVAKNTGLSWEQIDDIIVVGGSTRMPQILEMLARVTGKKPYTGLSPDESVSHGAAIYATMKLVSSPKSSKESVIQNSSEDGKSATPGTEQAEEVSGENIPDRSVARHSIIEKLGTKLVKFISSISATDVNPHSLGLVTYSKNNKRRVTRMIAKDTPLPSSITKVFGTQARNQQRLRVEIVEGESSQVDLCMLVGTCSITGLPADLPKGSPVRVTFYYDNNGCIHCKAVHVPTGIYAETKIKRIGGVDSENLRTDKEILSQFKVTS